MSIDSYQARKAKALAMGGPEKLARRKAAGILNARERIDRLFDTGSFVESGLFGASLVGLFAALPPALLATVAGTALLGSMAGAMGTALAGDRDRFAAAGTLAVTASGVTLLGVGSAFWGLCFGLIVVALDRLLDRPGR